MLVALGAAQVLFGMLVAVLGILLASRVLSRSVGIRKAEPELQGGNVAMGVLEAGAILSLAILCRPAVVSTFTAMDYLWRGSTFDSQMLMDFGFYALLHVGASLVLGAASISAGILLYGALTRRVDELAEIRRGNVAPALAIAAMMLAIALMISPGLELALDGMIPLPDFVDQEHGP